MRTITTSRTCNFQNLVARPFDFLHCSWFVFFHSPQFMSVVKPPSPLFVRAIGLCEELLWISLHPIKNITDQTFPLLPLHFTCLSTSLASPFSLLVCYVTWRLLFVSNNHLRTNSDSQGVILCLWGHHNINPHGKGFLCEKLLETK
jgi:hypothetical protein